MNGHTVRRTFVGQLPLGADLYEGLTAIAQREKIHMGRIQGLGATTHAVVAYYDQAERKYNSMEFPGGMEILNLHGNISLRDGKPFVHAHIVLGDPQGKVFGGHLLPGTKVFAFEVFIDVFEGEEFSRQQEDTTGLYLWKTGKLA